MQTRTQILRSSGIFVFLLSCLVIFSVRLILVQAFYAQHLSKLAEKQHNRFVDIEPIRGTIFDRNMRPLAFNIPVYSVFANPRMMSPFEKRVAIEKLPSLLQVTPQFIAERLAKEKYFVWLKRKLSPELAERVRALSIDGLGMRKESMRYYPGGELAAHILGFAGVDNTGLEGMELAHDSELKGTPGWTWVLRDARQHELMIGGEFVAPRDGHHVVLTIDETIQYLAERALDAAYKKFNALSASIVVIDVHTGEILALANRPTYNLSDPSASSLESRTNRAISFVLEPGSVFKIVAASAALEEGIFKETDIIFCENGKYRVANNILHDHQAHGKLSFSDVFALSSNIGVTKIAQKLSPNTFYKYAQRFRFGLLTGIDLKGEVPGLLKPPHTWSKTSIGAIPIGHEVLVTPVQLASAMAVIANDGVYMKPYIVKRVEDSEGQVIKVYEPQEVDRVISPEIAHRVKEILVRVIEKGTGKRALIPGMRVAGKTGTAQKIKNGVYSHNRFYATFIGFAPADNPRLAVAVVVDEPRPQYFGGTVAAPVFKDVMENALKYLGVSGGMDSAETVNLPTVNDNDIHD